MVPLAAELASTFARHVTQLGRSAFVRNVMVVMTGTAAAQVIGFALSPVISRLFTPSEFGVFGSFTAVSGVIAAGATLEFTQAIMLPKTHDDAINLFVASCIATLATTVLCLLCCLLAPAVVGGLMRTDGMWILAMLVGATLVTGLNQACQAWCVRVKAFRQTSGSQVVRSLSSNGLQVGLGCLGTGSPGLVVSSVVADGLASVNLARVLLPDLRERRGAIKWARIRQMVSEYRDFPQYSATMNILNALSLGLPVLLLTQFYGVAVAGAYAFGVRIIQTPMGFVTRSLRQVLFQKACEIHNEGGRLLPLFIKITLGMFAAVLLPSIALMVWGPGVFAVVFGHEWYLAGEFARSLVLWLAFMFCNLPSVLFARIIRIQRRMFVFDGVVLLARTAVLVLGGIYLSAEYTVFLFSLAGALLNVVFMVLVGRALHAREGDLDWSQLQGA